MKIHVFASPLAPSSSPHSVFWSSETATLNGFSDFFWYLFSTEQFITFRN